MDTSGHMLVFTVDGQAIALPVTAVKRVIRAVEITPLPKAPEIVSGVINVEGQVIPVFDLRRRFSFPDKDLGLDDHIIMAQTARRTVALVADAAREVVECPPGMAVPPSDIVPGIEYVDGVVKRPDGLIFIHDIGKFLSIDEEERLEGALAS